VPRILPSEVVRVIERFYPWVKEPGKGKGVKLDHLQTGRISAIVSLADRLPPELLTLNADEFADYIANVELLRSRVPFFIQHGSSQVFEATPVSDIYEALRKCPDQWPAPTVHNLPFITDAALRDAIRLDIDNAERAAVNIEWKAATVLGGAAIEALLLWKLETLPLPDIEAAAISVRQWKKVPPLDKWHLPDYVEVAAIVPTAKPVITADTAALLRVVRNYRNLIHPGAAVRIAEQCDKRTAYAALAGVAGVVNDLTR
jgi:hypothetical protein